VIKGSLTDGQPISRNGTDGVFEGQIGYLLMISEFEYRSVCGKLTSSYTLISNVNAIGSCFTMGAYSIVLDCNGYTINGSGTGVAIGADSQNYITIKNCRIKNFGWGIDFVFIQISNVINVSVIDSSYGFYIHGNSQNNVFDNVSTNNNSYGVYFGNTTNGNYGRLNTFSNSSLNSVTTDIYSTRESVNNKFVNTTFNQSKVGWGACSPCNFSVSWYGRVNVTNSTNAPLPANVNVSDINGKSAFSSTAGASGLTPWFAILDYYASSAGNTLFNDYSVNASYSPDYNLTQSSFNFGGRDYTFNITLFLNGFIPSFSINVTYGSLVEVFRDLESRKSSEFPARNYFLASLPLLGLAFVGLWKKDWLVS
jgi:hypothetical protein